MGHLDTNMKKKRDMYNMGGLSAHKSVGDLDLSLSATGDQKYQRAGAGATYKGKGFQVRGEASTDKFGNRSHSLRATKSINDKLQIGVEKRGNYAGVFFEKKF
tara:strand:- start:183 stop:491 length:309 start_codon:yes stop_codon:yes gene_type:complete